MVPTGCGYNEINLEYCEKNGEKNGEIVGPLIKSSRYFSHGHRECNPSGERGRGG